ncbi:cobalamin biosynthesis protein CobD [Xenococcus sp. PCC 7305]|uniref:adenosylcobinamide-phosphate synthase CbiB n=1 Tax=Xenococcus sp. PCC 7305 TaxID=102125 RepID=UPI0002AC23FA|nr:adenosylcobinamide-phosphate synthase CbiB [Xenococcus sp. PCC 7305]ELS05418.1 cobalamin biosynthesis protein CobD [Xenococcus sp. PCC 7305]
MFSSSEFILVLASIWDYVIGDPRSWLHPVQIMGWIIHNYTQLVIKLVPNNLLRRLAGIILGLGLILGSATITWLIIKISAQINLGFGIGIEILLLASCFAGKSLRVAAEDVLEPLREFDLTTARSKLSIYVGRDTEQLSSKEILRAILETVGENAVDGVTAPLFYGIIGALIPGVGPVPLAFGYKAASTLDSMIGYLREPYTDLGWFSAQLEDRLTWLPCRLTVLTLALFSGNPRRVLTICRRDAVLDPSPNSGWSESVYAAILGVQLGGINSYGGIIKEKPLLGNCDREITPAIIQKALALTRYCFLSWLAIAVMILIFIRIISSFI